MKAVTLASPKGVDNLKLVDLADPGAPGPGEIRVRLHASSLNYHDYAVVVGMLPTPDGRIPMSDGAGVVEAVGAGVREFAVGDSVVSCFFPHWQAGPADSANITEVPGDGIDGYAREAVVRPATWFTHTPKGYSHAEAATLTTAGLTAWRALVVDGGIKAGNSVLVLGTGGVSIFALQFARAMGASVIATSSSDEKLERVRAMGAGHTINYRSTPEWGGEVLRLTGGKGVDHVIEIGGAGTMGQSIMAVRPGGHISLIGVLAGFGGEVPTALVMAKQIRLQGLVVGSRLHQQEMIRAIDTIGLKPVIDRSFGLDGLGDAFRHEESGRHFGKICVEF